ncbi:DCC1-like thiol-disulfide oxidoreductase family protein [Streptomyces sp. YIM 130001]|uniref:thiol-disulfide oxidoreductase DCC family protein n=1 Tax=Streptomyces sp. YIM 130001 TaxID=2259644 RepID=UPI000E64FBB8|nr:DCC1-like thiol-disulfide oxidoreductase family protein [Streptomyces sp. YIM 130001]
MHTAAAPADRRPAPPPVRRLTVLYDAECALCTHVRGWLAGQRKLVPIDLVAAGSAEARRRFPAIDHGKTFDDITVIGDGGQLYRGPAAWVVTLWALAEHRPLAHRLATPAGARIARATALAAARYRSAQRPSEGNWGGGVYRRGDGWTYRPDRGWVFTGSDGPDGCADGRCATG